VRAQDLGLRGATDEAVRVRAASEGRVVLTHDVATRIACAYERVRAGQPMPGVIAVSQTLPVGQVSEDLVLVVQCSRAEALDQPGCGISSYADAAGCGGHDRAIVASHGPLLCRERGKRTELGGIRRSRTGLAFPHVSEPMQG
jgi:hypothetical protein